MCIFDSGAFRPRNKMPPIVEPVSTLYDHGEGCTPEAAGCPPTPPPHTLLPRQADTYNRIFNFQQQKTYCEAGLGCRMKVIGWVATEAKVWLKRGEICANASSTPSLSWPEAIIFLSSTKSSRLLLINNTTMVHFTMSYHWHHFTMAVISPWHSSQVLKWETLRFFIQR